MRKLNVVISDDEENLTTGIFEFYGGDVELFELIGEEIEIQIKDQKGNKKTVTGFLQEVL